MKFKRILTCIVMAIMVIAITPNQINSKTSQKKSSKKTALSKSTPASSAKLSATTFCEPFKESGYRRGYNFKGDTSVVAALKSLGFNVTSKSVTLTDEVCGEDQTWTENIYTCTKSTSDGTTTVIIGGELDYIGKIIFPSDADATKFINSAKAIGYKLNNDHYSDFDAPFYENPSDCYYNGTDFAIKGNIVFIRGRGAC